MYLPMIPRLPNELCEHIIDYLHDDNGALAACSCVSHAFLPRSRHHLWCRLSLNGCASDQQKCRITTLIPHRLGAYVRLLELSFLGAESDGAWVISTLSRFSSYLRVLKELRVYGTGLGEHFEVLGGLLRSLTSITSLTLKNTELRNMQQLTEFILAFPQLERLNVSNVFSNPYLQGPNPAQTQVSGRQVVPLTRLKLAGSSYSMAREHALFRWLMAESFCTRVVDLDIQPPFYGWEEATSIISERGPSLKHLYLDFTGGNQEKSEPFAGSLSQCTRLETLTIQPTYEAGFAVPRLPIILSAIASPCLPQVLIVVNIKLVKYFDRLELPVVAQAMRERLSTITLAFRFREMATLEEVELAKVHLKDVFDGVAARVLIQFVNGPP